MGISKFSKFKLEACMLYANMSNKELITTSGVGQSTLYEILSGKKKNPQSETLTKLAEALGVSVEDFFHDDKVIYTESDYLAHNKEAGENRKILSNISKLNTSDKKLIKAMIERFNK